jgi:outer membrane protein TolC
MAPTFAREKVEGQITEAWSNALPQVDALASYTRNFDVPSPQPDNIRYGEIVLTQPIYTFGRVRAGLNAAFATRRSTEHQANQTDKALELDVMRGFWSILLLEEVIQVRRDALRVAEGVLERMTRLRDVGMLSDFEVLRARSQVSQLVPEVLQAENNRNLAQLALLEMLGLPLDTTVAFEGKLGDYSVIVGVDTTLQHALARDDLEAMRDGVRAYEEIYRIYKTGAMPSLGAQVKYSWQWGDNSFDFNGKNSSTSLAGGIALNIPVWNSGRVSGKADQVRADLRKMQLDLKMAERGVQLQLTSSQSNYRTAQLKMESAAVAVNEASEARRIAEIQLENGQVTPLDLQTSQLNETSVKLGLVNAKYTLLVAEAELRLAAGQHPFVVK